MSRYRCNSCLGEYDDVAPSGVAYFHTCPPVTLVRARFDNGAARELPLRAYAGLHIVPDEAAKAALVAGGVPAAEIVIELGRREAPRAEARDEHTLRREGASGEIRVLRAEGKGRTPIAPRPPADPPVPDVP